MPVAAPAAWSGKGGNIITRLAESREPQACGSLRSRRGTGGAPPERQVPSVHTRRLPSALGTETRPPPHAAREPSASVPGSTSQGLTWDCEVLRSLSPSLDSGRGVSGLTRPRVLSRSTRQGTRRLGAQLTCAQPKRREAFSAQGEALGGADDGLSGLQR